MRLPPMTRQVLGRMPADAAAFFGLGLNPALTYAAADTARGRGADQAISGFDIFRELFGNIREVGGYVIPGPFVNGEVPNAGLVFAVNDVAKSRALWDQFLALPGMVEGGKPAGPATIKIGDTEATTYRIPDFGKVYLAELDGCIVVGTSRDALKAAVRAHTRKESLLGDEVMGRLVEQMPKDSTIMLGAHVGRLAKVAAGSGDQGAAMAAGPATELCAHTVAWIGLGQAPNQLTLRCSLSGLPNVNDALKKFAPMINAFIPAAPHQRGGDKDADELARVESKVVRKQVAK
jgi:hypothetical protein